MKFQKKDTVNPRKVAEFVLNAHKDFDAVQEMVEEDPRLVNATLDMGNGDWESALDAATHMGQLDMARHLIDKGARCDFLCWMVALDEVDIVRSILERFPMLIDRRGVHGFPLRHFAERGNATQVLSYLDSLESSD